MTLPCGESEKEEVLCLFLTALGLRRREGQHLTSYSLPPLIRAVYLPSVRQLHGVTVSLLLLLLVQTRDWRSVQPKGDA